MVCSQHSVDAKPTLANPNPTINLGYERPTKKARRNLVRQTAMDQRAECDYEMTEEDQPLQEDFLTRNEELWDICNEFKETHCRISQSYIAEL